MIARIIRWLRGGEGMGYPLPCDRCVSYCQRAVPEWAEAPHCRGRRDREVT